MITALMESKQRHLPPGEEGEILELVHLDMGCELAEAVYCNTPLFGGLQCKYKILEDTIVCQLYLHYDIGCELSDVVH